ncbi:hypothetical protein [Frigoriglobus tundricola]|uniref:Uncharacterized protein n=1 Tax=Frigoriglobus tundricola TaxID=2774151 RepID=A0A6M5Z5Y2_9BACT|nr:hypothetical protein [Frigoriglobus tundricola]QJX01257.1 hypothetical protein FTUN_8896 [Frigoriglobus tundricola]
MTFTVSMVILYTFATAGSHDPHSRPGGNGGPSLPLDRHRACRDNLKEEVMSDERSSECTAEPQNLFEEQAVQMELLQGSFTGEFDGQKAADECVKLFRPLHGALLRLKQTAEDVGIWPGEGPSLGAHDDVPDAVTWFGTTASACDFCFTPPPKSGGRRKTKFSLIGDGVFKGESRLALEGDKIARYLAAAMSTQAIAWGIEKLQPGVSVFGATRGGKSLFEFCFTHDVGWVTPFTDAVSRTMARCLSKLDLILLEAPSGKPEPFIPTPKQHHALQLLTGRAMCGKDLAKELRIDEAQLNRTVTTPLQVQGRVKNDRKLGGYFRPDAPPEPKPSQIRKPNERN